jgi:PIN domain nuclease of toxin-antitoxin system
MEAIEKANESQLRGVLPKQYARPALDKTMLDLVLIEPADAARAARLPCHHGDPFDRILIAQRRWRASS